LSPHGKVHPIRFDRLDEQLTEAHSFDCIVVGGGDGTISSVLTSPALPERQVLPIALGTANDLARELGILRALKGLPWTEIPAVASAWTCRPFATWQLAVDGLTIPFSNYCSIGFEGAVVADFHRWRTQTSHASRTRNRAMYTLCGLRHLSARLRGLKLACEASPVELEQPSMSLIFTNIQSYLGMGLSNTKGSPSDLNIECIATTSTLDYMRMIGASSGITATPPTLCSGRTMAASSIPSGTFLQVDGESRQPICGESMEISFRKMISILAP
jgi:diacylglycerol kinase family enzyme